jgi:hypothetical protein
MFQFWIMDDVEYGVVGGIIGKKQKQTNKLLGP